MKAPHIRGIVPPLVTPLTPFGEIDADAFRRLLDHVVGAGVHGVFELGTCGEGPSLGRRRSERLVSLAAGHLDGAVPLLANASSGSLADSLEFATYCRDAKADAVALAAPVHYPLGQAELLAFLRAFAESSPLPVLLYNAPKAKVPMEIETIEAMADVPSVFGIKESAGDADLLATVLERMGGDRGWTVFTGPERLYASHLRSGGHGGVCAGSNIRPALFVETWNAAQAGDWERVDALEADILALAPIYGEPRTTVSTVCGLKNELARMGICRPSAMLPLVNAAP